MKTVNLSPNDLANIIRELEKNIKILEDSMRTLKNSTTSIGNKWKDDQYEVFKKNMQVQFKKIKEVAQALEAEKELTKKYKKNIEIAIRGHNKDKFK